MDDARKSEEASKYKGEEKPRFPRGLDEDEATPLQAEALARDEWRGGGTSVAPEDSGGHTLPASEDDDERMKSGGGRGSAGPSTILPPD